MQAWVLLGVLILAELVVVPKIPAALARGVVPLNPLGWFGYAELEQVEVDRRNDPLVYWLTVGLLVLLAAIVGLFIYAVAFRSVS